MHRKKTLETAKQYTWGDHCQGWHLLESDTLSVIQESMPPGTAEVTHFHEHAQQLFYILSGTATFDIEQEQVVARTGESVHISPNTKHQIKNLSQEILHFLVISEPKAHGDRIFVR